MPRKASKKFRGRPPKPAEDVKTVFVQIRMTHEEKERLVEKAKAADMTVADYVRSRTLDVE